MTGLPGRRRPWPQKSQRPCAQKHRPWAEIGEVDAGLDPGVLRAGGGLLGRPASQPREATGSPRPSAAPEELPGLYWPSSRPGLHRPRVVVGSPPAHFTARSPLAQLMAWSPPAQGCGRVSASPGSWPGLCRPSSRPGLHWPRVVAGSPLVQLTAGTGVPVGAEEALKDVRPQEPTLNAALGGVTEGAVLPGGAAADGRSWFIPPSPLPQGSRRSGGAASLLSQRRASWAPWRGLCTPWASSEGQGPAGDGKQLSPSGRPTLLTGVPRGDDQPGQTQTTERGA